MQSGSSKTDRLPHSSEWTWLQKLGGSWGGFGLAGEWPWLEMGKNTSKCIMIQNILFVSISTTKYRRQAKYQSTIQKYISHTSISSNYFTRRNIFSLHNETQCKCENLKDQIFWSVLNIFQLRMWHSDKGKSFDWKSINNRLIFFCVIVM